jgi:hypothetical protein
MKLLTKSDIAKLIDSAIATDKYTVETTQNDADSTHSYGYIKAVAETECFTAVSIQRYSYGNDEKPSDAVIGSDDDIFEINYDANEIEFDSDDFGDLDDVTDFIKNRTSIIPNSLPIADHVIYPDGDELLNSDDKKYILIETTGSEPNVAFYGDEIAGHDEETYNTGLWRSVNIYKTIGGKIIVVCQSHTNWAGSSGSVNADIFDNLDALKTFNFNKFNNAIRTAFERNE